MSFKLIGKNTATYSIGNVALRASSFLLIPLYTHHLSVADYGLLATLLITIQMLLIFMGVGMRTCLLRFAGEYEDNNQIHLLLGTTTFITILGGLVVTAISVPLFFPFFQSVLPTQRFHSLLGLTYCAGLMQSLSIHLTTYYVARNQAIRFTIVSISGAILLFLTTFILVYVFRSGIIGALSAYVGTYAVMFLFVSLDIFSRTGIGISIPLIPGFVRFGYPLVLSMASTFVMGGASIYFLNHFLGLEVVAIYSLGRKLAQVVGITLLLPFHAAFQPFVYRNLDSADISERTSRLLTYLVTATMFMSFLVVLASRAVLPFIAPPAYSSALSIIALLLPGMGAMGIYNFAETLVNAAKKTYLIGYTTLGCAVFSIVLNYMLVPKLNWYGAVIASNVSQIMTALILMSLAMKEFVIRVEWKEICNNGGLFVSFMTVALLLQESKDIVFYSITVAIVLISLFLCYWAYFRGKRVDLNIRDAG